MSVKRALDTGECIATVAPKSSWAKPRVDFRLISTEENYPWIGTDKKIFLCLVSSGLELMTLINTKKNVLVRYNLRIILLSGN
jgi:hypothetical protein